MLILSSIFVILACSVAEAPPAKKAGREYIRGCYYTNWSQYRPDPWKFLPENYQLGLCTHIFYAFVVMKDDFSLKAFEWNDEDSNGAAGMYSRVNALKQKQSGLKTLLSFGGWTFSQSQADLMRRLMTNAENRRTFVASTISFVRRTGFDGFDIDWEYPDGGTKAAYTALVKELRESFENESTTTGKPRLLLTAGVAAGVERIAAGYDGKNLAKWFDFLNVMTYDLHGSWEPKTGLNAPLYDRNGDRLSVSSAMTYWSTNQSVPKDKLVVGLATYGRGWTVPSGSTVVGAPANGPSSAQTYTRESGTAAYYEICSLIESGQLQSNYDNVQKAPFAFKEKMWVSYDDVKSINEKLDWLMEHGYAGAFVWDLDMDDFLGRCASSADTKFPLVSAMRRKLGGGNIDEAAITLPSSPSPAAVVSRVYSQVSQSSSIAWITSSVIPQESSAVSSHSAATEQFRCPGSGLYTDPSSCSSFYQCDDQGNAHQMPCPAGLHFNQETSVCDWPDSAGCDTSKAVPL